MFHYKHFFHNTTLLQWIKSSRNLYAGCQNWEICVKLELVHWCCLECLSVSSYLCSWFLQSQDFSSCILKSFITHFDSKWVIWSLTCFGCKMACVESLDWHTFVPANRRPRRSARNRLPRGAAFLLWGHPHPSQSPAKSETQQSNKVMFCWKIGL